MILKDICSPATTVPRRVRALSMSGDAAWGLDLAGNTNVIFRNVNTGGKRGETLLTNAQKSAILDYIKHLAPDLAPTSIRFVDHLELNTAYGSFFDILHIGTDVMPAANAGRGTLAANSRISWRGSIAHELVGHREAALAGRSQPVEVLEEVQASIRAARFAPQLSNTERITLLQDAMARLKNTGLKIRNIQGTLYISHR